MHSTFNSFANIYIGFQLCKQYIKIFYKLRLDVFNRNIFIGMNGLKDDYQAD